MKQFKKFTIIGLFACLLAFNGCEDWLNVPPKDRVLEEEQFATETRINSALNGLYRSMAQNSLYGATLTQTFIEYMARFYAFMNTDTPNPPAMTTWSLASRWQFDQRETRNVIQSTWGDAFRTILEINIFIDNVTETDAVRPERRDIMLGEAYALRAFMHFDMFRLFGPIMGLDPTAPSIPFADSREIVSRERLPANVLIERVLQDLNRAEQLLKNDPVRTRGVNDNFHEVSTNHALLPEEINAYYFRNRRMNFYAVRALRARVLLHAGEFNEAREVAREVLAEATAPRENGGREFRWETNRAQILGNNNFMFYNEVLFGITNPAQHSNWTRFFDGTRLGHTHVVAAGNLFGNIFGVTGPQQDLNEVQQIDIRAGQWRQSNIPNSTTSGQNPGAEGNNTFISTKFRQPENWADPGARYMIDFQPLIRLSELPLIIAEVYFAENNMAQTAHYINIVRANRGATADHLVDTIDDVWGYLRRQVYGEFVGEGQAFFFLKRNASETIFLGSNTGFIHYSNLHSDIRDIYVLPLPDTEVII